MIFLCLIVLIVLIILITILIIENKYKTFVLKHSILLKKISVINSKYQFKYVKKFNLNNSYDNENIYNEISPDDYLIYNLVFIQKDVKESIRNALNNINLYDHYIFEVNQSIAYEEYDKEVTLKNKNKLLKYEKKLFKESILNPTRNFNINVELKLTNINRQFKGKKVKSFTIIMIEDYIKRINNKLGDRYNDEDIWNAICRVERGKVTNKMRFSIYQRDNYRCKNCGRSGNDLEIDHIIPIAKGGKTIYSNLQTLCHNCNVTKSDTIEIYKNYNYGFNTKYCPNCKVPLKLKHGKYGDFYGCMNYPKCTYTEKVK